MNKLSKLSKLRHIVLSLFVGVLLTSLTSNAMAQLTIDATSVPPGQKLKPGVAVLLTVSGLEQGQKVSWHHNKSISGDIVLTLGAPQYGQDFRLFYGDTPGPRTFVVQVPSDGEDPFTVCEFHYGNKGDDEEDEDEDEDEDDIVPPTPTPGPKHILIIEETEQGQRTPEIGNILDKLRSEADTGWMKEQGHTLLILDKNLEYSNGQPHPLVVDEYKKGETLPIMIVRDPQTQALVDRVQVPATYDEVVKLIQIYSVPSVPEGEGNDGF